MMWTILILILVMFIVLPVVVKLLVREDKLQSWAHVTAIVSGVAAAISLVGAAYTYYDGAELQKKLAASNIYQEHMKLSIANPDFANASLAPKTPDCEASLDDRKKYEQYRWYMGHALYSFESILDAQPNDAAWTATAKQFIIDHRDYIASDSIHINRYSPDIRHLVNESLGKQ